MKILVLNGSPRGKNSNTLQITTAFLEGLNSRNPQPTEIVHLGQMAISPCRGCFTCWTKTPGKCVIQDDMQSLIDKYLAADLIIWSFPLYYYGMPSGTKAFLDRLLPTNLPVMEIDRDGRCVHPSRYDLSGKRNILISTCGFYSVESNYEALLKQFELMYGKDLTTIICPEGELFKVPQLKGRTAQYLATAEQAGAEYASKGSISPDTKEKLSQLLFPPETFLEMANASWDIESSSSNNRDKAYAFMKQMAAIYNPEAFEGEEVVIEMHFTDLAETFQLCLNQEKCTVRRDNFTRYTTRIETPYTTWLEISQGKINGARAMMEGKYKVLGDFNTMLKMEDYFGSQNAVKPAPREDNRKTHLPLLLFPWLTIWILLPVNTTWGSVGGIMISALLPLLSYKWKITGYEKASIFLVSLLGVLGFLHFDSVVLILLSYLLFGLMWLISAFGKIPLTAYYSCNEYNGEQAFQNPLFIKTNRILTALWGILYLATAGWSIFLMSGPFAPYTGLINSLAPALMGLFTAWFAKWYPAKVARG